jgi:hypothetical protein
MSICSATLFVYVIVSYSRDALSIRVIIWIVGVVLAVVITGPVSVTIVVIVIIS